MALTLNGGRKCVACAFRAADRRLLSLSSTQVRQREHQANRKSPTDRRRKLRYPEKYSSKEDGDENAAFGLKFRARRPSFLSDQLNDEATALPHEQFGSAIKSTKRWVLRNEEASPDVVVHSRYWDMIKELEELTFGGGEGDKEGDAPRVGEIFGISKKEEFRALAEQFWNDKIQNGMDWATRIVKPWTPIDDSLSEQELKVKDFEGERIYGELFDQSGSSKWEQKFRMKGVLKKMFLEHLQNIQTTASQKKIAKNMADFRYPTEWYPAARAIQRTIHLHIGPTNSGKTYHALKRLEEAQTGVYAGPLRLLAHEVYSRLNAKGKSCALITGEERRIPENHKGQMSSCTVEMVPLNAKVEVAVIDEIQMMANPQRGWAWTQAFLGVQATEVHLCGEVRTKEIIEKLCKIMGDELVIHNYERLTPLECMGKSFGNKFDKLQKGDAVVVFSRVGIHAMKKQIEAETGKRCAVVYGSLPPETRAQQAALFNDQDNDYDYLVASDAVGMGLNLAIRRVIFESTAKFNGKGSVAQLSVSELKQIAGRAGRYKTAAEGMQESKNGGLREDGTPRHPPRNVGLATTLDPNDHLVLKTAMETDVEPIKQIGILPPTWAFRRFSAYFPRGTPFTFVLSRLPEVASVSPHYFMCDMRDQNAIADAIEHLDLGVEDRCVFMAAPADYMRSSDVLVAFASHVAANSSAELLDIAELEIEILDVKEEDEGPDHLQRLEKLHNALTLYLWLSYRFAGVFVSQPLAFHVKSLVEEKIEAALSKVQISTEEQNRRRMMRKKAQEGERLKAERRAMQAEEAPSPYSSQNEDEQEPLMDPLEEAMLEGNADEALADVARANREVDALNDLEYTQENEDEDDGKYGREHVMVEDDIQVDDTAEKK